MDIGLTILAIVAGSSVLQAVIVTWANRKRTEADTSSTLAENALAQVTSLQARYDELERDLRVIRQQIYTHQQWDVETHRKVIQHYPDHPPPPKLLPPRGA